MLLTLYGGNTSGGDVAISLYSSKAVLPYIAIRQELLSLAWLTLCQWCFQLITLGITLLQLNIFAENELHDTQHRSAVSKHSKIVTDHGLHNR